MGYRRPVSPGIRAILGDEDAEVMESIWSRPAGQRMTVHDIYQSLDQRRRLRSTSVGATVARLARRGLLHTQRHKGDHVYYATSTRQEFLSAFLQMIRDQLPMRSSRAPADGNDLVAGSQDFLRTRAREVVAQIVRRQAS